MKTLWLLMALSIPELAMAESLVNVDGFVFSSFMSGDWNAPNPKIEKAIFVVHGSDRNADRYFETVTTLARESGKSESTFIVAPHFKIAQDAHLKNELIFTDEGWLRGDSALNAQGTSSFDVMDRLISKLCDPDRFPNLKTVVITGHSAGGQFTQRYALGSLEEEFSIGKHFRYLVANPGSYVYLNKKRANRQGLFEVPDAQGCAYNDYKYGLDHLNRYLMRKTRSMLISNYLKRDVTYLLGDADTQTAELDQSCQAELEGSTRFERGRTFKTYLDAEFPTQRHALFAVPGVGHTEWGMYSSDLGRRLLFQD